MPITNSRPSILLKGVQSLSFEDPWLASAASDGSVLLIDVDAQHRGGSATGTWRSTFRGSSGGPSPASCCHRYLHTPAGPAYCVDLSDQRVVCGSESETVRVWDFTDSQAQAERALAAKASRGSRKQSRKGSLPEHGGSSGRSKPQTRKIHSDVGLTDSLLQGTDFSAHMFGTSPPVLPPVLEVLSGEGGSRQRSPTEARSSWYHARQRRRSHGAGRHAQQQEKTTGQPI